MSKFAVGLDYGTNSVRALIVNAATGEEVGTHVWDYPSGESGIVTDSRDPHLARQQPLDYIEGLSQTLAGALRQAETCEDFSAEAVVGIGVDATGSTPLPVDAAGEALVFQDEFKDHPAAMAWLWKDHTAIAEATEFTERAREERPQFLAKCGGAYSSEWYWSKVWRCLRTAPDVFAAAHTWVELPDWIPALLTGTTHPDHLKRGMCAAGHKAAFHPDWGGYPDAEFLAGLDPNLAKLRATLPDEAVDIADAVGGLTSDWAEKLGLPSGIPVAAGAIDAHMGGVGAGIQPGTLIKIMGTSGCDMAVAPLSANLPDIPGVCGIVPESILPGYYGLEAGQAAVGDVFNWFVQRIQPGGEEAGSHAALTEKARALRPGESGLLALDWHNGNRNLLADQRLTGMVLGLTLHSSPPEIYRALIEATAFGARAIMERFIEYDVRIDRMVNCGGISAKSPMVMQIYADVMNRPMEISRSTQTCALGAAMAGAVVGGAHADFASATAAMTGVLPERFEPDAERATVYDHLYALYKQVHDAFGMSGVVADQANVMKELLAIREAVRGA